MKKELFKVIEMDKFEYGLIINALNELRNQCIKEGKTTEVMNIMDNNIKTENNSSLVYGGPLIIISCIMLILTLFV